jgi:anti-sigma regulatory factor (Ser/Thr protein kinase)
MLVLSWFFVYNKRVNALKIRKDKGGARVKARQKPRRKNANLALLFFVLLAAGSVFLMHFFGNLSLKADNLTPVNAVFDCTNARPFHKHSRYYLEGEWEFYYRQFIESDPQGEPKMSEMLNVPSSWAGNPLYDSPYESGGYASYRAYIKGFSYKDPVTIYIPNIASAYRIYLDGQLVTESGTLSKSATDTWSTPSSSKQKILLTPEEHEIVIEISSESYSGLYLAPIIADHSYTQNYTYSFLGIRYAFIGIVIYAAIILFILGFLSKVRYFSGWLPVLFLCLAFRMMISTEGYAISQPWFFNLSYERMTLLMFASTFIIKLVSLIYLQDELRLKLSKEFTAFLSAAFLLVVVGVSFLPTSVYNNYYFVVLQLVSTLADLYVINRLCQELAKGDPYAGRLCFAYLFIFAGITVDALYTNGMMPFLCSSFMPVCLSLFALQLTIIHADKAAKLFQRAREARELEREVEKANMAVMISQIQPHFLYNALNTIKSLIRRDPKKAEQAVIDFSYYLRGNMDSLTHTEPIPFETELAHVKYYCDIELLRFSDKLKIEYDIQEKKFCVPTLSIQPIVENAIKHGVTKKTEGGTVRISTASDDKDYIVTVKDDGVGFDPSTIEEDDGRSHVGIQNIRYRFENMMHATVSIESEKGVGTCVTIRIPKNSATQEQ